MVYSKYAMAQWLKCKAPGMQGTVVNWTQSEPLYDTAQFMQSLFSSPSKCTTWNNVTFVCVHVLSLLICPVLSTAETV